MNDVAFLDAIRAEPDDDAPRLVYADWLEERGDGDRAEFIRVQCRLAALPPSDPRRPALEDRQDDLLALHEAKWLGTPSNGLEKWQFRRGFVDELHLTRVTDLERLGGVFTANAVRRVEADEDGNWLAQMRDAATLERVTALTLGGWCGPAADWGDLKALLTSPRLAGLNELRLPLGGPFLDLLGTRPGGDRLAALRLQLPNDAGVARLAADPRLTSLASLALRRIGDHFTDDAVRSLAARPGRWTSLDLRDVSLTPAGFLALARFGALTHLAFTWPRGHQAALPLPPNLRSLELWGRVSLVGLADLPCLPQLEELKIGIDWQEELPLTPVELAAVGRILERLSGPVLTLDVGTTTLPLTALTRLPALDRVRSLTVQGEPRREGISALAACSGLTNLISLSLPGARNNPPRLDALAEAPFLGRLRELEIFGFHGDDAGLLRLLRAGRKLTRFCLQWGSLGEGALAALAAWPGLRRLRELNLLDNRFDREAVQAFLRSPHLSELAELYFSGEPGVPGGLAQEDVQPFADRFGGRVAVFY